MTVQPDDSDAAFNAAGEPIFRLDSGVWVLAAHFAWELTNGPLPPGYHLVPTCGDKRCVNPAHGRLVRNTERWERRHTSWYMRPA